MGKHKNRKRSGRYHRPGVLARAKQRARANPNSPSYKALVDYIMIIRKDPCVYCWEGGADSIDHIVPHHSDQVVDAPLGKEDWSNLAPCHRKCNAIKGSRGLLEMLIGVDYVKLG